MSTEVQEHWEVTRRRDRIRVEALARLWAHAASEMRVRHSDPRADVAISVRAEMSRHVIVRLLMQNVRDTSNQDRVVGDSESTGMNLRTDAWPGYVAARQAIAGAWMLYVMHETAELVSVRERGRPDRLVANPHADYHQRGEAYAATQELLQAAYQNAPLERLREIAGVAAAAADRDLAFSEARLAEAARQHEVEVEHVRGDHEVWQ